MPHKNKGLDPVTIEEFKSKIQATGQNFIFDAEDEASDEYAHFYFVAPYEQGEAVYDAAMYTLRLHHESELYEVAEERALKHFPNFKKITQQGDEDSPEMEEIGMFLAEVILELEEEESVKVREHVDQDVNADFGISLDIGLHVETITREVITTFVRDFNNDTLSLDDALYAFQSNEDEAGE